jgi:hypothetical protein
VLDPCDPSFHAWAHVLYPLAWLIRNGWPWEWVLALFIEWSAEAEGLMDAQGRDVYPGPDECESRLRHAVDNGERVANPKTVLTIYGLVRDRGWEPAPLEATLQPAATQDDTGANGTSATGVTVASVSLNDFYSYLPMHQYFYIPTRALWPACSVDSIIRPIRNSKKPTPARQ